MNFLEYQRIADQASDRFWLEIGGSLPSENMRLAYVIIETNVRYLRELRAGDPIWIDTSLVAYDQRRLHLYHSVRRRNQTACVVQILGLAFNLDTRRATQWPQPILEALAAWRITAPASSLTGAMDWKLNVLAPPTSE
jgi:acyl-CoA thioester hydrolase